MLNDMSPALSKRVVMMLQDDGLSLNQIAKDGGTTAAYLKKVLAKKAPLKRKHLDKLDDVHPELPFRIGAMVVKEETVALAKKAGRTAKKVGKSAAKKGGEVVDTIGRTLRKGAWKLLDKVI